MFVDDTMLFCRANKREINTSEDVIDKSEGWSGQQINKHKSGLIFSRILIREQRVIQGILGMSIARKDERYLGNPLFFSQSRRKDFSFLKEKVMTRLEGWKAKLLSKAGRAILIQFVVQSIPMYTMSTFKVPQTICHEMDMGMRRFWWTGNLEKARFLAWKNWQIVPAEAQRRIGISESGKC